MSRMRWQVQFVLLAAMWGASFLCIKVLGEDWPVLWVALGRIALGAATLLVLLAARRERLPGRSAWPHLLVAGLLINAIPFTLFAYGETKVPSVVAGLWNATTPLWVLVFVLTVFGEERPGREQAAGLALGFAGVVLVLGPWSGLGGDVALGHLACAGAALCYGLGFPYTRRHLALRPESGVALSAGQLLCATALLLLVTPLSPLPSAIGVDSAAALLVLGALGTGVAFAFNYAIIAAAGAATASSVTYLVPVVSTALGVLVLGEPLRWNEPAGAVVVLLGIALSQGRLRRRTVTPV
jgi:drug/metabolite transporter (DMT)-like permease